MTPDEFNVLASTIKEAYPNSKALGSAQSMALWFRMLGDMDYNLVSAALGHHICTNKFPPTIAELREECNTVLGNTASDWLTAWKLTQKAIARYGFYRLQEGLKWLREQDALAADVAERLGWRTLCTSENPTADRANFRQSYETYSKRETELKKLPPQLREQLTAVAENMMIGDGAENV